MSYAARIKADGTTVYDVEVYCEKRNTKGRRLTMNQTVKNKQTAIDIDAALKVEAKAGGVRNGRITVSQLLEDWCELHGPGEDPTIMVDGQWSASTRYGYERIIQRDLKPILKKKVAKLTGRDLDLLYATMRKRGVSPKNAHACIRAALNQARKWKFVPYNVANDATPGTPFEHEGAVATDVEVEALAAAVDKIATEGPRARAIDGTCGVEGCETKYYGRGLCSRHWQAWRKHGDNDDVVQRHAAGEVGRRRGGRPRGLDAEGVQRIKRGLLVAKEVGVRRSELAGLDWADFDWRNNTVKIQRAHIEAGGKLYVQPTKTHATRTIPLAADVVAVLKPHRGIGSVCGMRPSQLSDWLDYLCGEAGIEPLPEAGNGRKRQQKKIGWHAFRHALLTELGAVTDIRTVADIGGHATLRTTEKYMHSKAERAAAAIDALAAKRQASGT